MLNTKLISSIFTILIIFIIIFYIKKKLIDKFNINKPHALFVLQKNYQDNKHTHPLHIIAYKSSLFYMYSSNTGGFGGTSGALLKYAGTYRNFEEIVNYYNNLNNDSIISCSGHCTATLQDYKEIYDVRDTSKLLYPPDETNNIEAGNILEKLRKDYLKQTKEYWGEIIPTTTTTTTKPTTTTTTQPTTTTTTTLPTTTQSYTTQSYTTQPQTTKPNTTQSYTTQSYTTQPIMNNITQLLPNISYENIVSVLNSGVDLMKLYSDKNYMSEKGINFDSQLKGPSTNIYQKNFSGTSNVYSPYLYYNGHIIK